MPFLAHCAKTITYMATRAITLTIAPRDQKAKASRRQGNIPGVLYGHGLKSHSVQVESRAFLRTFEQAGSTTLVKLTSDTGDEYNVLIREVQFHPIRNTVAHIDFYQVRLDEEVEADVPLIVTGESPAVKNLGGIIVRSLDTLHVQALPQNLPHDIPVDIANLAELEQAIHIADLTIPEGVTVLDDPATVVVLVQAPRSTEELDALSQEVTEDVTKVEGVKEEEPPAEEADATTAPEEAAK